MGLVLRRGKIPFVSVASTYTGSTNRLNILKLPKLNNIITSCIAFTLHYAFQGKVAEKI